MALLLPVFAIKDEKLSKSKPENIAPLHRHQN